MFKNCFMLISILLVLVMSACGNAPFTIVEDTDSNNFRNVRVTTEATSDSDFKKIAEEIRKESTTFDAIRVYIHDDNYKPFGDLKATITTARTQKGLALTGNEERYLHVIERK